MSSHPCPNCQSLTPQILDASSQQAYVWYYRCGACGHVWTISKDGTGAVRDVTLRDHLPRMFYGTR